MVNLPHWPGVPIWQPNNQQNKKLSLEQTRTILSALGDPHKHLPPTIHIAGTNGKGSSVAMLKSIFEAASLRVHSYTSPHLIEFNERINLAGKNISDYHLFELLEMVRIKSEELNLTPSFFEGTTIAAFLAFSTVPADLLILETGMGGRLDATNVIENPVLTLITSISFDHMSHLGTTLGAIASEKAGIIKSGVPCVIAPQTDEVYEVLLEKCEKLGSPAFCYEYDYVIDYINSVTPLETTTSSLITRGEGLVYRSQKYTLSLPYPSLFGAHQCLNASAVIAATLLLNDSFKISGMNIANGLKESKWPGRIEKIESERYSHLVGSNVDIYLDGAHNDAGALALSSWIKETLAEPVYLIIGMTKNRNVESFCSAFKKIINQGRAVKVISEPSSYHPEVIANIAQNIGININSSDSLLEALQQLAKIANGQNATIIITGSLFLVSDFYKLIK